MIVPQAGTAGQRADQEDHLPTMTVMTEGEAHKLIIERNLKTPMAGAAAPAEVAVAVGLAAETGSHRLLHLEAGALLLYDSETGKGTGL